MVTLTAVDQATDHHQAMGKVDMARLQDLIRMEETHMAVVQAMATGKVKDTADQVQVTVTGKLKEDTVDQDIMEGMEGIKIGMEDIVIWKRRKTRRMIQKTERKKPLELLEAWKQVTRKMQVLKLKALRSKC